MKKLIIILLLSFVINETPECKVYEVYDPQDMKCVGICQENEYYNEENNSCETCNEGEIYVKEEKRCFSFCPIGEYYNENTKSCENKCKNGEIYN